MLTVKLIENTLKDYFLLAHIKYLGWFSHLFFC